LEAGLVSYAYTRSLATVNRLSEDVEAGNLVINDFTMALPEMPYGGIKESGYGVEGGSEAIAAYQFTKLISYAY
ncbi:MAG: aldehyde dehydrogenase family protein, partial [Candidimonas sp.]